MNIKISLAWEEEDAARLSKEKWLGRKGPEAQDSGRRSVLLTAWMEGARLTA